MENLENRELMFSDQITKREQKRVRKLSTILVCIGIFFIGIFLIILLYYKQNNQNQKYIDIALNMWYTGIEEIEYKSIIIKMDNKVQYSLSEGISSIGYEHINVKLYINDNISIVQDKNCISIKNKNMEIVHIKFGHNEKITQKHPYIIWMFACISIYMILSVLTVSVYKSTGERRMLIEAWRLERFNKFSI